MQRCAKKSLAGVYYNKEYMSRRKLFIASGIVLVSLLSAGVGFYFGRRGTSEILANLSQGHPLREQHNPYKYINPLLAYESGPGSVFKEYTPLESELSDLITDEKNQKKATAISVYYKDLGTGRWVGIGEDAPYIPASLLKAVIMIAYFKQAEDSPDTLQQKLLFSKEAEIKNLNTYDAPSGLEDKQSYTISDLIRRMIVDSDNGAKDLLLSNINRNSLNEVYTDLGLKNPDESAGTYTISAKNYSLFFRVLYNSTYLSRQYSEEALKLLGGSTFSDGLLSGLPKDTVVAHKFGESVRQADGGTLQIELHDCGIVYKPGKPFLLCIMTKGSSLDSLKQAIQNLTRVVYEKS